MAVHGGIGDACVEMRGLDGGNFAPVGEARWRDVSPGLASVPREMNQSSVASGPNQLGVYGRGRYGIDHAITACFRILDGQRTAGRSAFSDSASEVRTDLLPVKTAVDS